MLIAALAAALAALILGTWGLVLNRRSVLAARRLVRYRCLGCGAEITMPPGPGAEGTVAALGRAHERVCRDNLIARRGG